MPWVRLLPGGPPCPGAASRSAARHGRGRRQRSPAHQTGCGQGSARHGERLMVLQQRVHGPPSAGSGTPAGRPQAAMHSASALLNRLQRRLWPPPPAAGAVLCDDAGGALAEAHEGEDVGVADAGHHARLRKAGEARRAGRAGHGQWPTADEGVRCDEPDCHRKGGRGRRRGAARRRRSGPSVTAPHTSVSQGSPLAAHLLLERAHDRGRQRQALHVVGVVLSVH